MFRIAGMAGMVFALTLVAQEPKRADVQSRDDPSKKPQWQRMLTGVDRIKVAIWLQQIDDLKEAGKNEAASKVADELLTLRTRLQGADHWQVRDAKNLAEELKRPPLTADRKEQFKEARRLHERADVLNGAGRYKDASREAERCLKILMEVQGPKHPDTATSLNNLAVLYDLQGRYAEAEPLFRDALRIRREAQGNEHPDTAQTLNNLAMLYKSQARYPEAEPLFTDALRIRREALGEMHAHTASSLNNLAVLYSSQGRYSEAEPLFTDALRITRQVQGEKHPEYGEKSQQPRGPARVAGQIRRSRATFS